MNVINETGKKLRAVGAIYYRIVQLFSTFFLQKMKAGYDYPLWSVEIQDEDIYLPIETLVDLYEFEMGDELDENN